MPGPQEPPTGPRNETGTRHPKNQNQQMLPGEVDLFFKRKKENKDVDGTHEQGNSRQGPKERPDSRGNLVHDSGFNVSPWKSWRTVGTSLEKFKNATSESLSKIK
jgi:hypothetical protein